VELGWMVDSLESDTGRFVVAAREALYPEISVAIFTSEGGIDEAFRFPVVLYSLSNSASSLPVWLALMKKPGIAVLHDSAYYRLFAHYYLDYLQSPYLYLQALRIFCGKEISVESWLGNKEVVREKLLALELENAIPCSMVELIAEESLGLMVASGELWKDLKRRGSCLCAHLPSPENPNRFRRCFTAIIKRWAVRIERIRIALGLLKDIASSVPSMDPEVSRDFLRSLAVTFREVL
jgi:hypothetical protein